MQSQTVLSRILQLRGHIYWAQVEEGQRMQNQMLLSRIRQLVE
jgi:hypothetical protein